MTLKERTDALASVPVFAGLSRRSLERIAHIAKDLELPAGRVLIEPRAKGSGMFVVLDGAVTVGARGNRARARAPHAGRGANRARAGKDAGALPRDLTRRLPKDPHRRAEGGDPGAGDGGDAARVAAVSAGRMGMSPRGLDAPAGASVLYES